MRVEAWKTETCLYNADVNATGSARRTLPTGTVDGYTLLASLGGRRINPAGPYMHYTEDACILCTKLTLRILRVQVRRYPNRKPSAVGKKSATYQTNDTAVCVCMDTSGVSIFNISRPSHRRHRVENAVKKGIILGFNTISLPFCQVIRTKRRMVKITTRYCCDYKWLIFFANFFPGIGPHLHLPSLPTKALVLVIALFGSVSKLIHNGSMISHQ